MKGQRELLSAAAGGLVVAAAILFFSKTGALPERELPPEQTSTSERSDRRRGTLASDDMRTGTPHDLTFSDAGDGTDVYIECSLNMSGNGEQVPAGGQMGMDARIWLSGEKIRQEMSGPMGQQTTIVNSSGSYKLLSSQMIAVEVPGEIPPKDSRVQTFSLLSFAKPFDPGKRLTNARIIGSEKLLGVECDIWVSDSFGPPQIGAFEPAVAPGAFKFWFPKAIKPQFPLKAEIASMGRQNFNGSLLVTKLELGRSIPDSQFTVPEGYTIKPLGGPAN